MTIRDNAIHLRSHKILVNTKKTNRSLAKLTARISKSYSSILHSNNSSAASTASVMESPEKPIATLRNSGNTCYLNSIIYVLRFTSGFLHNLHHLLEESARISMAPDAKAKSSSLGRNAVSHHVSNSSKSNSTKDLLSIGLNDLPKNKVLAVTERLHEVFVTLHNMEHGSKHGPYGAYLPNAFLQAVREANSIFCSDDQQDAHELLLYLFANICDTCNYIGEQVSKYPSIYNESHSSSSSGSNNKLWLRLTSKNKQPNVMYSDSDSELDDLANAKHKRKAPWNFLVEDFQGTSVRRTKCLECENVTQCKEQFYDLSVPIRELSPMDRNRNPSELYREACLAKETLCGNNKFYCNDCRHLNEAVRSIAFESLPNIMILQQKRFMHTTEGCDKVNTFMPTPVQLDCFCETCMEEKHHSYILRGVVMHVGGTMQSGHYKAYVAASEQTSDYMDCALSKSKSNSDRSSLYFFAAMKSKYSSENRVNADACSGRSCCSIKVNLNLAARPSRSLDDVWLECNDDKVRLISVLDLEDELAYKEENMNTPYLLFYEKIKINRYINHEIS